MRRKSIGGLVAALVMGLGLAVAPAAMAPASAESYACLDWNIVNGDGAVYTTRSLYLRVAPASECAKSHYVAQGTYLYLYCRVNNIYGNEWWFARVAGTSRYGWVSADNLHWVQGGDDNGDGRYTLEWCW
jgi:hypothetical protein